MAQIICLGILVADVIARPIEEYPAPGELNLCPEIRPFIGGCAANTGIGLQRLGIATAVAGKVGRDGFGAFIRQTLETEGVDARGVIADETAPTSATMVMVAPNAERSFIHCVGANATLRPADFDWNLASGAQLLHIAGHFLMPGFDGEYCRQILEEAQKRGLKTSLDTAGHPTDQWREMLQPLLPFLDYLVPSFSEARHCVPPEIEPTPEKIAAYFLAQGVGTVALKMGEDGSYLRSQTEEFRLSPYSVEAVDATGAGDAFAAGFLAGVARGFELETCGKLGNAAGACCVTQLGTVAGVKSFEETMNLIGEN